jgi:dTDP-4-dehydrorhamnose 3,5-epimerase
MDEIGKTRAGIHGVEYLPLREIPTEGGSVLHMLRADAPHFTRFGEVYFSECLPGSVKAWKRHREMTQNFAVPAGRIRVVIYDDREDSPTRGTVAEYLLGRPDNYALLRIPPMLWYGFTAADDAVGIICNCADMTHRPDESERMAADSHTIPYHWPELNHP